MAPRADEFVSAVMAHLGVAKPTDLVRAMGWGVNDTSTVSRWQSGKTTPSYARTMDMLERCGWLSMTADAPARAVTSLDPLEEIADIVSRGFQALGVTPEELRPRADGPRRKADQG